MYKHEVDLNPRTNRSGREDPARDEHLIGNQKTALSATQHAFKFAKYANLYLAEGSTDSSA